VQAELIKFHQVNRGEERRGEEETKKKEINWKKEKSLGCDQLNKCVVVICRKIMSLLSSPLLSFSFSLPLPPQLVPYLFCHPLCSL